MLISNKVNHGLLRDVIVRHDVNLGTNPACPEGKFSVWMGLQGTFGVGDAIVASDADIAGLDRRNSQAD